MTPTLKKLMELRKKTTQGEWKHAQDKFLDHEVYCGHEWNGDVSRGDTYFKIFASGLDQSEDCIFAAEAHNLLPQLAEEVKRLERALEKCKKQRNILLQHKHDGKFSIEAMEHDLLNQELDQILKGESE